ncbi:MAG TPA: TRAP transporter TatT component family protein [Pyrinomonadaceae bacterium]|jgi:tetratricopeptide (TPR) repeat protein
MDPELEELTRRADELYDRRAHAENVGASVRLLEEAADEYEAAWRMGRALFFLGQEAEEGEETRAHHARGVLVSERAARLAPRRVEGHFWLGVNLALLAQTERPLKALVHALRARRSLLRAASLDAGYHAAGPLRVLARLQHKLPRFAGGGAERARANFERAVKLAPANTVTRLYFAELLLETGDAARARIELETLLNAPHDPFWDFESERDRRLGQRMLNELK